jgi:hypothetical protein
MSPYIALKKNDFQLVTEFSQPDSKKRISLGGALGLATAFNIYRNEFGQVLLDPVKTIPVSEGWIFDNPLALASVKQGLKESAAGKQVYRGSFAKFAKD